MHRVSLWLSNAGSRTSIVVAAVCLLALGLRLVGLQYGLPAVYNPDEVSITARALSFARGSLNPHNFLYPTFYFYVLFAWIGVYLAFVWLTGRVSSLQALQQLYFTDPSGIYTAGRTLGVAAGTATVAAIYGLASRLTDRRTALAAAVFLAVSPLPVRDSHYVKHDVPAALMVVLAYLAMTRVWPHGRRHCPSPTRHGRRRRGVWRRALDALLLRVPGDSAGIDDRAGVEASRPVHDDATIALRRRGVRPGLRRLVAVSPRRADDGRPRRHRQSPDCD